MNQNTAIITGASSGMGKEMARQIDRDFKGIKEIWLIARRKESMEELAEELSKEVKILCLDLTNKKDLHEFYAKLLKERPDVKFLVNAAGYGKIGKVGENSLKDETGMVRLNCEAMTAITHMVLPYMREKARIIQFASAASFLPQPKFAIYAATKSYVLSYNRALSAELRKRKIYVTSVCPGPVDTEFFPLAGDMDKISLIKKLSMVKAPDVVAQAIEDSRRGKSISIYGGLMKVFFFLCKIVPHRLLIEITEAVQ